MKLTNTILATLACATFANAQATSDVVGYVTETIQPGFNLIGLTLHENIEVSGAVTADSANTITDANVDFSGLTGTYILEVTSGTASGTIQEITTFGTNSITTPEDLSAEIEVGDSYSLRKAATIGSIFGTGDSVIINKGTSSTGDIVYLPNVSGGFDQYYHTEDDPIFGAGSWATIAPATGGAETSLIYSDAIFIQNRGSASYDLVVSGALKSTATIISALDTFNYISNPYPAGTTLNTSGLTDVINRGTSSTGDIVYIPNETGGFDQYYHTEDDPIFGAGSWAAIAPATGDSNTVLTGGIIIQRRGGVFETQSSAPAL